MSNQSVIEKSGHSTGSRKIAVMPAWPVNRQSGQRQQATAKNILVKIKNVIIEMIQDAAYPILKMSRSLKYLKELRNRNKLQIFKGMRFFRFISLK